MNNTFGKSLRTTIFGASHAEAVGVIMEGVPAGITLHADLFAHDIDRRRPSLHGETPRKECDMPIIKGLDAHNTTTGNAITIEFKNSDTRSKDYTQFETHPRPSHADLTQRMKYGEEYNLAGGGMASGRMTVALVAAGVVAKKILSGYSFRLSTPVRIQSGYLS